MKAKNPKVGDTYYNPFREYAFTVMEIKGNTILCKNENGTKKLWDKKELKNFNQNSINRQLPNWEWNVESNLQNIRTMIDSDDPCEILDEITEKYNIDIPSDWVNAKYEYILRLPNSTKGAIARKVYTIYIEKKGSIIDKEGSSPIVDGRKKCIKSACMKSYEKNQFNNIRQFQDWDDLVFVCIYPNNIEIYEIDKKLFIEYLKEIAPEEVMWAGGKEKKERLDEDIERNDYFQWAVDSVSIPQILNRL